MELMRKSNAPISDQLNKALKEAAQAVIDRQQTVADIKLLRYRAMQSQLMKEISELSSRFEKSYTDSANRYAPKTQAPRQVSTSSVHSAESCNILI